MKILVAPDSFKDALPALAVCEAIKKGILAAVPNAEVHLFPLSDGGEGAAEVLHWHLGGELVSVQVNDPLFRPILAGIFCDGKMAFVEMAQASGLQLLKAIERNPLITSTFGTGELILEAMRRGASEIYLTIGGSATNDAGIGMAAAFGWRFLNEKGNELLPVGENLNKVTSILSPPPNPVFELNMPKMYVLCDVENPLFGPIGAAQVFAPQKGANEQAVKVLDEGLKHFSKIVSQVLGKDFSQDKGAGAAGGLGFGAMAFLGASMKPGAESIMQLIEFEHIAAQMDLIVTGEGKLDGQTAKGKLVNKVASKALELAVPTIAFCGVVDASEEMIVKMGLKLAVQLKQQGETNAYSIARTATRLESVAYNVLKTMEL